MSGRGSKPGERRGGRKKGVPNKINIALKEMILSALNGAGGIDYLKARADDTPGPFLALLGKILPTQITGDANNPLILQLQGVKLELAGKLDRLAQ